MKKLFTILTIALTINTLTAQVDTIVGDVLFTQSATTGGTTISNPASAFTKDIKLTKDKIWILKGFVYVRAGATMTIEPGTIIRGDKITKGTLVITRGAKLIAEGTASLPIVFTSNQAAGDRRPGDWGGVIMLGKAKNNGSNNNINGELQIEGGVNTTQGDGIHGGTDDADNSGILKYVRIEYSGIAFVPNSEINGLTLGSIGRGTKIEYVQVSFNGDDSFEWFGGTVDAKYLVSYGTTDDDFDTDNGFSGRVQFGVVLRDPRYSDVGTSSPGDSNGFESDNNSPGNYATPYTSPVFSNMTVLGLSATPVQPAGQYFNLGARLRRNTRTSIHNSVIMGFPNAGVFVENIATGLAAVADSLQFRNNVVVGNGVNAGGFATIRPFSSGTGATTTKSQAWLMTAAHKNDTSAVATSLIEDPFNLTTPNFKPKAGSVLLSGAEFTSTGLADAFFEKVAFKGAVGPTSTWLNGWTNFNPQTTDYTKLQSAVTELKADIFKAQVNPNPVKDVAALNFSVEKDMNLAVTIYDLMGKMVSTQTSRRYSKGSYTIDLNTSTIPTGLYFINFTSEEGQKTIRFSVSK